MTNLLYLQNTYQFTETATVQSLQETEHGLALILDQTIFYPQGGGQPFDTGTITNGETVFTVDNVRLTPEGTVYHYGTFTTGTKFENGAPVQLEINQDRRLKHACIHSAGHLIDIAIRQAGITGLTPTKGFHTPEGAYVEYEGPLEDPETAIKTIEKQANQLVQQGLNIIAKNLNSEEANQRGIYAPPGKSARFVYFKNFESEGCGCGGTHVASTAKIGPITIRKIKSKKGVTRVSYQV